MTFTWYWAVADNVDSVSRKVRKHLFTQPCPTALSRASSLNTIAHIFKSVGASFGFIYHFSTISLGPAADDSDELANFFFKFTLSVNAFSIHNSTLTHKIQVTDDYTSVWGHPYFGVFLKLRGYSRDWQVQRHYHYIIGLKGKVLLPIRNFLQQLSHQETS